MAIIQVYRECNRMLLPESALPPRPRRPLPQGLDLVQEVIAKVLMWRNSQATTEDDLLRLLRQDAGEGWL